MLHARLARFPTRFPIMHASHGFTITLPPFELLPVLIHNLQVEQDAYIVLNEFGVFLQAAQMPHRCLKHLRYWAHQFTSAFSLTWPSSLGSHDAVAILPKSRCAGTTSKCRGLSRSLQ